MSQQDNNEMYESDYTELGATDQNKRSIKNISILVIIAFAIIALAGWAAVSFIQNLMHPEREEKPMETVRRVEQVPENVGKVPDTLPETEPMAVATPTDDKPKDDTPQGHNLEHAVQ